MTTDATRPGPLRIRTSDSEREKVATILRAAMTEGRLTLDEGEERLTTCYATTYRDELLPLTADLPDHGRQALAHTPEAVAATRRERRSGAAFLMFVTVLLTGLWALSGAHFFWPIFPLFFLFMGFARRNGPRHHHHHYRRAEVAPWNAP